MTHESGGAMSGACAAARQQFGELLDNELGPQQAESVRTHMQVCPECRQHFESLSQLDAAMQAALSADLGNKAEELASEFASVPFSTEASTSAAWQRVIGRMAAVAAAVLLLAVLLSQWGSPPRDAGIAARLVAATGRLEVQVDSGEWRSIAPDRKHPTPLVAGCRVRTPEALCEIHTDRDGILRLDEFAEIVLMNDRQVELVRGRFWYRGFGDEEFTVIIATADLGDGSMPGRRAFTFPANSELQWMVDAGVLTCGSLTAKAVPLKSEQIQWSVDPGMVVAFAGQPPSVSHTELRIEKSWQIPLLHHSGSASESELHSLLESVLSQIGRTKASYLYESQIRALGPSGAAPLLAYALSQVSKQQPEIRLRAARIGAEMADRDSLPQLKRLARDDNPAVRLHATRALKRLSV